jgi:hypothetical protein
MVEKRPMARPHPDYRITPGDPGYSRLENESGLADWTGGNRVLHPIETGK